MKCTKCNEEKFEDLFSLNSITKKQYKICNSCRDLKSKVIVENKKLFEEGLKMCSRCYIVKDLSSFRMCRKGMNGLLSDCKDCCYKREAIKRHNNLDKYKFYSKKRRQQFPEYENSFRRLYHDTINGYASKLYSSAKTRALKKNLEFTITSEFVRQKVQSMICESTGFTLTITDESSSRVHPLKPTLDRIDNSKGYTPENTKVVCWWWNVMKQDWSEETVKNLIKKFKNE